MNKKIKVIDLLNRIYRNLDVPKNVKYNDLTYKYDEYVQDYKGNDGYYLFERITTEEKWLNVEVEILEDEEKINIQNIQKIRLFEDIAMCLKRLSDFVPDASNYVDRFVYDLEQYKKINKED